MIDALLIYPRLGSMDTMVVDLPLSILYAAAESVKRGYNIKCLDVRVVGKDWKKELDKHFKERVLIAGVSVMTGHPLKNSREISLYIRERYPETKILWGGPHVTVLPDTVNEPFVDFGIRGNGSFSLAQLITCLKNGKRNLETVPGLSYRLDGNVIHNPRLNQHEFISYRDIPYHLIDVCSPRYVRTYNRARAFPIFSATGCPYQCSFCVHPAIYREINGPKWIPLGEDEVLSHIKYVQREFGASHIVFMDDTSFPNLRRMSHFFQAILDQHLEITMEFRGARINEIERMDDEFLDLMVSAGGRVLMVGVESGNDRILATFQKGIKKEQILEVNRKLARHPQITPHYNFIYGCPGETYEELLETKNVVLQLLQDNPNAYFGFGGDWKPIPGSQLADIAKRDYPTFRNPQTIDEWIEMDSSDARHKIVHPWYSRRQNNLIKLLQVGSFVLDNKIIRESKGNNSPLFKTLRSLAQIYRPIALSRLKWDFYSFMFEYNLWQFAVRLIPRLVR
jgi:radical SAM superfamily enzyme YgiQ (UPF0313 family)